MFFDFYTIPQTLLRREHGDNINILIGENGSGKSTLLRELAKNYLFNERTNVIAIANTIHDKFNLKGKRFNALRASAGKSSTKTALKAALKLLANDDNKRINNIAETLKYVNLDPTIGIKVNGFSATNLEFLEDHGLDTNVKQEIRFLVSRFTDDPSNKQVHKVHLYQYNIYDFRDSYLISILKYEKLLISLKIIRNVEVFLCRNNEFYNINEGSSGELTLITSLLYLTSSVDTNSIILIDEPENSLHPKWQKDYIKMLMDLFYRYEAKIIIATHSPLIINAAEIVSRGVKVFKGKNGKFTMQQSDFQNVEEIYQEYFNVTTPENRYLSQSVVKMMNQLAANEIELPAFEQEINNFKNNSYSDQQIDALNGIIEMGKKIKNRL